MEKLKQEKGLTGWLWEMVPGDGGVCWWRGSGLLKLNIDEHSWEHWWAALQLCMWSGNNRKNGMSLETLQCTGVHREALGTEFSAPICKLLSQEQVQGRCIQDHAIILGLG